MKKIYFLLFILVSFMYSNSNGQSITLLGDTVYLSIDSLSFDYEAPGFTDTDWIGIYPDGLAPGGDEGSTAWDYITSTADTLVIKDFIPGGVYRAYLLCCDGYEVLDSTGLFTILEPKLTSSAPTYFAGEPMSFTYESPMFSASDWIGIYPDDDVTPEDSDGAIDWDYITSDSGAMEFTTVLTPGNYIAYLLCCDGYRILASVKFVIEDSDVAYVRPVKSAFGPSDDISFQYNDPDYESGDWIGVYYEGDDPDAVASVAWKYVSSTNGILTLDDKLPAGSFEAYLFCCDVTDIVLAESEVFTSAGGAASSYIRTSASVYPEASAILINYRSTDFTATDWIGIYDDDGVVPSGDNPSIDWDYAPADSGTVEFTTTLIPGDYVVYLLCCDGYDVKAKYNFKIADATTPLIIASSLTYAVGDTLDSLVFTYASPDFTDTDWIGTYNVGDVPGDVSSIYWDYITGTSGTMVFDNTYDEGNYWAGLFCCDGYDLLASTNFSVVEGSSTSTNPVDAQENKLTVFPNPSSGQITLLSRGNSSIEYIEVYNVTGNLMYQREFFDSDIQRSINLSSLDTGIYILKAKSESHTFTTRIILE